ncbi:MAG: conjugative transposon protein TraM [Paludibacteraceae bacterium]|nr:conjugative transposon protein TraM [Paludibacteraceae bacterium]
MKDFKDIDSKKLILFAIPIGLACLFAFVFFSSNSKSVDADDPSAIIIPDSEADSSMSKIDAYTQERYEKKRKEYEKNNTDYSDLKFFDDLTSDDEEQPVVKQDIDSSENQWLNEEELYEKIVLKKQPKTSTKKSGQKKYVSNEESQPTRSVADSLYDAIVAKKKRESDLAKIERDKILNGTWEGPSSSEYDEEEEGKITGDSKSRTRKRSTSKQVSSNKNLIQACIHSTQTVSAGSTVMMRLLEPIKLSDNSIIPENTIFYGVAQISKDRMTISVTSIKYGNHIEKVNYTIYDNDAIQGLNLPDNVKNQIAKQTSSSAIDNVDIPSPSSNPVGNVIKGTTSVIKSISKSKVEEVKVTLKANYKIFIK